MTLLRSRVLMSRSQFLAAWNPELRRFDAPWLFTDPNPFPRIRLFGRRRP